MMMNVHNKYRYSFNMFEEKYVFKGTLTLNILSELFKLQKHPIESKMIKQRDYLFVNMH